MKRLILIVLSICLMTAPFLPAVYAEHAYTTTEHMEFFEDGSYLVFGEKEDGQPESDAGFIARILSLLKRLMFLFGKTETISKTKFVRYYDSKGTLLWTAYLHGSFQYNGKKASCQKANMTYKISDKDWTMEESQAEKANNIAKGQISFSQHKLGIRLKTITRTLVLTCDKNGNIT